MSLLQFKLCSLNARMRHKRVSLHIKIAGGYKTGVNKTGCMVVPLVCSIVSSPDVTGYKLYLLVD